MALDVREEYPGKPICGQVETEILVSPSSKKVAVRLVKSIPKAAGIARLHSYQKPVETAMYELLPRSWIAFLAVTNTSLSHLYMHDEIQVPFGPKTETS
jgi:hypothetical protein